MAKKKTNSKKEPFTAFKVSEGRAKKAKKNQSNINFKKFNLKTKETVEKLDSDLNRLDSDVRTKRKPNKKTIIHPNSGSNQTAVNIDDAVVGMSNL